MNTARARFLRVAVVGGVLGFGVTLVVAGLSTWTVLVGGAAVGALLAVAADTPRTLRATQATALLAFVGFVAGALGADRAGDVFPARVLLVASGVSLSVGLLLGIRAQRLARPAGAEATPSGTAGRRDA